MVPHILAASLALLSPQAYTPATLPMQIINNHAFVDIRIGDSRPLHFMIETGGSAMCVASDTAAELGLPLGSEGETGGAGTGSVQSRETELKEVHLGKYTLNHTRGVVMDLDPLRRIDGFKFDGFLTNDVLSSFVVNLDYGHQMLSLYRPDKFTYSGSGVKVSFKNENGVPVFPASVVAPGMAPVEGQFLFDTGAGGKYTSVVLAAPFLKEHALPGPQAKIQDIPAGIGVGGSTAGKLTTLAELRIGDLAVKEPFAVLSSADQGFFAKTNLAGVIGTLTLRRFNIFIDYGNSQFIFEKNADFDQPFGTL